MELIRGLHNIKQNHHGCLLTIGKFDGVHLGHQSVLKQLVLKAKLMTLPSTVMVFEPQPEELFSPQKAPARLSRLREKYREIAKLGIDRLLCVRFSRQFSRITAEHFVKDLLVDKLGVKFLVVGDDFKFGRDRLGDFGFLQMAGKNADFDVVSTESFMVNDCRISSTAIRQALFNGQLEDAKNMLGKRFYVEGKVVAGEQNGRRIGFPTANLPLKRASSPIRGVFAAIIHIKDMRYKGVVNVGIRPTLGGSQMQLEAHLFDFNGDLYGRSLTVEFVTKIRDEIKFTNLSALQIQIKKDAEQAKMLLQTEK